MPLLERASHLTRLETLLAYAGGGTGRLVLIGGEAGSGKSALVACLAKRLEGRATVLVGACDPLSTPRPLGPLMDIALSLGGELARAVHDMTHRSRAFDAMLALLRDARRPVLVVFEDVHWADEATLDLLRYLGRRLGQSRAVLVATYRDDELHPRHPLHTLLGDLATYASIERMQVAPLSVDAVRALASGTRFDPLDLHRRSGGNPFFVTEILAAGQAALPASVRDAVLARVARFSLSARSALDAAAVIGLRVEPWLLKAVAGDEPDAVDDCIASGVLRSDGAVLTFRHELARAALLWALPAHRSAEFHRRILKALQGWGGAGADVARLAHHAEAAADDAAVLEFARLAAERARAVGAHREAAAQFARALRFAGTLGPIARARLLDAYANECFVTDQLGEAIPAREAALAIWRAEGDRLKEGEGLTWLARAVLLAGQPHADRLSGAAIDVLEQLPRGPELARAYRVHAHLRIEAGDALQYGQQAIKLAEELSDIETLVAATNTVGTTLLIGGQIDGGREHLERSLRLATEAQLDDSVGLTYSNLGSGLGEYFQLKHAGRYLWDGIAYCEAHDIDRHRLYMLAWQALVYLYQGRWTDAAAAAHAVLHRPGVAAISRITALLALGRLHARRGDDATEFLGEALELAERMGVLHRQAPVRIARAEAAWLTGDMARTRVEARAVFDEAVRQRHAWHSGALAFWRWQADDLQSAPPSAAQPYALHIAGDWHAAAAVWRSLGCPYEEAQALADGDEAALLEALATFQRLEAKPMAAIVAGRLRSRGVRAIPRGPRAATRAHPASLTRRQAEVLQLVADGLSNAEISGELVLSERTVVHHVSAILAKLGARTRAEAVEKLGRPGPQI